MYVICYTAFLLLYSCVPVDPPDTEFDCVGINGEGSYYTTVVGGVSIVYSTVQPSRMCQNVRVSHFQTPLEYKSCMRPRLSLITISSACTHHHHANFCKDPHRKDYHA